MPFLLLFNETSITKDSDVCGTPSFRDFIRWHFNVVIQSRCSFCWRLLLKTVNHAQTEHPYLVGFSVNSHWVAVSLRQLYNEVSCIMALRYLEVQL